MESQQKIRVSPTSAILINAICSSDKGSLQQVKIDSKLNIRIDFFIFKII